MKRTHRRAWMQFGARIAAIVTLCLVLFLVLTGGAFVSASVRTMTQTSLNKAGQVASNLDRFLERILRYTYTVYNDPDVFQWIHEATPDTYRDIRLVLALQRYLYSEPYMQDIVLFNARTERIYSMNHGMSTFSTTNQRDLLAKAFAKNPGPVMLQRLDAEGPLMLAYPASLLDRTMQARMALLISPALLTQDILGDSIPGEHLFVVDAAHQVVLGTPPEDFNTESWGIVEAVGDWRIAASGGTIISEKRMENHQWTVYHTLRVTPLGMEGRPYLVTFLVGSIALFCVLTMLLMIQSWRSISPYDRIADLIKQSVPIPGNEENRHATIAELLHEGLNTLLSNTEQLRQSLTRHEQAIRREEWTAWLLGGVGRPDQESGQAKDLTLVVLRLESYGELRSRENYAGRMILKHTVQQSMLDAFSRTGLEPASLDMEEDHFLLLIPGALDVEVMTPILKNADDAVRRSTGVVLAAAVGHTEAYDHRAARMLYGQLYEATFLHFLWGEDRPYTLDDYAAYQKMLVPVYDDVQIEGLISAIRTGDEAKWQALLSSAVENWRRMPYADVPFRTGMTAHALTSAFSRYIDLDEALTLQRGIANAPNLESVQQLLAALCASMTQKLRERQTSMSDRWQETMLEVVEYIRSHLQDPNLSVDMVAAQIGISTNYLRKLFKDYYDTSLSDYIRDLRMEEAIRLLVTTDLTVVEIMGYTGFASRSSFFTVFKRQTGMTPEQYRKDQGK